LDDRSVGVLLDDEWDGGSGGSLGRTFSASVGQSVVWLVVWWVGGCVELIGGWVGWLSDG
jgi:hypothetical protein